MDRQCLICSKEIHTTVCPHCGYPENAQNEEHQLPAGTVLHDRYTVGKVLGQGGFGITYLAWDNLLNRQVAVKEFFPTGTVYRQSTHSTQVSCVIKGMIPHYERSRERFLREAQALVRFQDIPEVVNIHDFFKANNTAYIIMEFIRGVDLAKYIQHKGGSLSVDETFRLLRPVMEALAKVHKSGVIHRDISPDNIILDPMGGAKILDFGAIRVVENPDVDKELDKSTEAILKRGFAPLEQYNTRGSLGPWTDEYSICATIWYCLTGKLPEDASIRMSEGIDPDWSSIPALPEHQRRALEKGFSCRAKDRYPDMDELLAALFREEPSAVPEGTQLSADGKKQPPGQANRIKNAKLPAIAAVAFVAAVAVLVFAFGRTGANAEPSASTVPTEEVLQTSPVPILQPSEEVTPTETTAPTPYSFQVPPAYRFPREIVSAGVHHSVGIRTVSGNGSAIAAGILSDAGCNVGGWNDLVDVALGEHYTVGLHADGILICTGYNDWGACEISDWSNIACISAGWSHTVGLTPDGSVIAVGANSYGQCDVSEWRDIVAISAGTTHTVGLKADGSVVATGSTENAECDVSGWSKIVAVSTGSFFTVGLKADGTVVATGYNGFGQCNVSGWTDIVAISAGDRHTLGLKADGTVVAAGWNQRRQCDVSGWTDIVAISAGAGFSVGAKSDGTAVATGENTYHQCDVSDWNNLWLPVDNSQRLQN